ncbi:MAG: HepT-like ribonuclease domain-containing protein [Bryobacteraceae bacterium]
MHHLQVIGEAARGVSQPVRDRHPEVQWPQIVALRNILVHEYFGLNLARSG